MNLPFLWLLFVLSNCVDVQGHYDWQKVRWLNHNYLLKWRVDTKEKVINFRVEATTKGWVGFGLSRFGRTEEVDMVIGWVDDVGQSTFNVNSNHCKNSNQLLF